MRDGLVPIALDLGIVAGKSRRAHSLDSSELRNHDDGRRTQLRRRSQRGFATDLKHRCAAGHRTSCVRACIRQNVLKRHGTNSRVRP